MIIIWLIPKTTQDPDPLSTGKYQRHIKKKHFHQVGAILLFLPLLSIGFFIYIFLNSAHIDASTENVYAGDRLSLLTPSRHSDPNPARGGSDIVIQDSMKLVVANRSDDQIFIPKTDQISLYTVREGDSLSYIADTFEVSINTIRWANDLGANSTIAPGDQLVILPVSGIRHTVRKGDTLAKIAQTYESDVMEIRLFNGLGAEDLEVGSEVIIPNGELHNQKDEPKRSSSSSSSSKVQSSSNTSGYFTNPAPGARKTQGIHGRNAVDLGAPIGTPVYAAASGTVIISKSGGWNGGYGTYIVIKHGNGTQTLYAHLSGNNVSTGHWVEKGSRIGSIGNTGKSTGPHLHFEVRGGNNPF